MQKSKSQGCKNCFSASYNKRHISNLGVFVETYFKRAYFKLVVTS